MCSFSLLFCKKKSVRLRKPLSLIITLLWRLLFSYVTILQKMLFVGKWKYLFLFHLFFLFVQTQGCINFMQMVRYEKYNEGSSLFKHPKKNSTPNLKTLFYNNLPPSVFFLDVWYNPQTTHK